MSQVMKALHSSEQGYHSHHTSSEYVSRQTEYKKGFIRWYHILFLVIPTLLSASFLIYESVEKQKVKVEQIESSSVPVEWVSADSDYLPYPLFESLKSTYIESLVPESIEKETVSLENDYASAIKAQTQALESSDLNLNALDLSELSPALAMRVESALKNSDGISETEATDVSETISLIQNADKFVGKLPAMDFQTHVYASNVNKRWIKMNGVEYQEGDQMPEGVKLEAINPQATIVRFENELIEIPALYTWKG